MRNIGAVEGNRPASDNDWQTIVKGGDSAIQKWIDEQLRECCCTVVLIGEQTAERKWIRYEIEKSWREGKGVFGIHIHGLKDLQGEKAVRGRNPFNGIRVPTVFSERALIDIAQAYVPPLRNSKRTYEHISDNMSDWIDEAIFTRNCWRVRDFLRTLFT